MRWVSEPDTNLLGECYAARRWSSNSTQTQRHGIPWTLVETLDNKLGAISRKTLKWRHDVLPS